MVGAYIYSQALNRKEARQEADYLIKSVSGCEIDLPLVMDYEFYKGGRLENSVRSKRLSYKKMTANAEEFCAEIERNGYESMLYGNKSFLTNELAGFGLAAETQIWLAHYTYNTDYQGDFSFWQCSSEESVAGLAKKVDRNFWYIDPRKTYKTERLVKSHRRSISRLNIELDKHSHHYMGFAVEPDIKITDGKRPLLEGTDFTVAYIKNSAPGKGYIIVTGKGKYKDRRAVSFKIKKLL